MATDESVIVYLGLGSNVGDRLAHLDAGAGALTQSGLRVRRASSIYAGPYVGPGAPQPAYLNAVLEVETRLAPIAILHACQTVEHQRGRTAMSHMQPRPLDVDVLLYGHVRVRHPQLIVPHPRLDERRFVLEPLAELGVVTVSSALGRALQRLRQTQPLRRVARFDFGGSRERVVA